MRLWLSLQNLLLVVSEPGAPGTRLFPDRALVEYGGAGEQEGGSAGVPPRPTLSKARARLSQPCPHGLYGTQGAVETSLKGRKVGGCTKEQIPA